MSGWNNILSSNRRQETSLGVLESVMMLPTFPPGCTEQSLVQVTVKNFEIIFEIIKELRKKDRIFCILPVTNGRQPARAGFISTPFYIYVSFNLN